jgi:hypothetical protein
MTIDVHATSPTQAPGSQQVFDPADEGAIFNLNLLLPSGDHAIIVKPVGDANLFRNNNVTGNPYPFTIPGLISFYGNSATTANDPMYYQGFYYYLYNMKVRTLDCISNRTPVVAVAAPTPAITYANDSLVSTLDAGHQWYLNGNSIVGANGKKHKPVETGIYTVGTMDNFGCLKTSLPFTFSLTAINPVANAEVNLKLAPNPGNGILNVSFNLLKREDLAFEVVNAGGQSVFNKSYGKFQGSFNEQLNLTYLASGVYMIRIHHGSKTFYNKIVIQK